MKFLTALCLFISVFAYSQQESLSGEYNLFTSGEENTANSEYTLELYPDGTFSFQSYRQLKKQNEERLFVQGTWVSKGLLIELQGSKDMDLSNTKARFDTKTQKLVFYESKIPWVKGLKLPKDS